jgi:hypothetical protein
MFQAYSVLPEEGTAVQKYARVEVNMLPHALRLHLVRNVKGTCFALLFGLLSVHLFTVY